MVTEFLIKKLMSAFVLTILVIASFKSNKSRRECRNVSEKISEEQKFFSPLCYKKYFDIYL